MFPLNSNDQYIDSNGKRSKLGDTIGSGGGGSELPEHTSADAGKVLKVADDGSLEWDEAGGAGGVYVGTTDPDPLIGENGDYYYKRSDKAIDWLSSYVAPTMYSSQAAYGNEFVANSDIVITALKVYSLVSQTGKMRIGDLTDVLQTTDAQSISANGWTTFELQTPINISKDDHFIIQLLDCSQESYVQTAGSYVGKTSVAEYVKAYYGSSYPGNTENNTRVMLSFEYDTDYEIVTDQYFKKSEVWTLIS